MGHVYITWYVRKQILMNFEMNPQEVKAMMNQDNQV